MAFKDLLVVVDRMPGCLGRRDLAFELAALWNAHLTALYLVAEPYVPAMMGINLPPDVLRSQLDDAEADAKRVLDETAQAGARRGDFLLETRRDSGMIDQLPSILARHARHADLVIVGQPNAEMDGVDDALLAEAAFMNSGRPALVVPFIGPASVPPKRAMIAWDGSREAVRAVNDALPLLLLAERVDILVVDAPKLATRVGQQPGADLATHLARHGVRAEVEVVSSGGLGVGDVVLSAASDRSTDLIVMGGYGHSRLREFVLGGVTEHMLAHMTVPVLLSH